MKIAEIVGRTGPPHPLGGLAEQALTGTITKFNRINGTVEI